MSSTRIYPPTELTAIQLRTVYSGTGVGAIFLLAFGAAVFVDGVYGLLVLGFSCALCALSQPRAGLWLSVALIMAASLVAPPAAFESGYGYSPELAYWASAICIVLAALSIGYVRTRISFKSSFSENCGVSPPIEFYGFAAVSVLSAIMGLVRGYPLADVGKQFYGCLLFIAYFLFVLTFTRGATDVEFIVSRTKTVGLLCALVYIVIYLSRVPSEGFRKELTILSAYAGGIAVLYLPGLVSSKRTFDRLKVALPLLILFAVPLLAQYKRAVLAFVICALLAMSLRSSSRSRRYLYTALAFSAFTVVLSTNFLNPIGAYFAKYESLRMLFPEDIQSSYSVYLRLEELRQVLISLGGVPVFGTGMGSTFVWYDPYSKFWLEQQTIASGWGYLIVKTGIVGTLVFVWLAARIIRSSLARPLRGVHLGMFLLFVFQLLQMVADPFFLNFMTSLWAGMTCGFLCVLNACPEERRVTA